MKKSLLIVAAVLALVANTAWATPRTIVLVVSRMTCATCPITVKKALRKVDGVTKVDVSFEKKQAVVTYDDAKTNVERLIKATTNAGYPSTLVK